MTGDITDLFFICSGISVCVIIYFSLRRFEGSEIMIKYRSWANEKWWRKHHQKITIAIFLIVLLSINLSDGEF